MSRSWTKGYHRVGRVYPCPTWLYVRLSLILITWNFTNLIGIRTYDFKLILIKWCRKCFGCNRFKLGNKCMASLCINNFSLPSRSTATSDEASLWIIAVLLDTELLFELLLIIKLFTVKLSSSFCDLGFSSSISTRMSDDIVRITKIFKIVRRKGITLAVYRIRMLNVYLSVVYILNIGFQVYISLDWKTVFSDR